MGIDTVEGLRSAPSKALRRQFGVVIERTHAELNGEASFDFETSPKPKEQIMASRSFAEDVTDYIELQAAVATHAARATEKLRRQRSHAGSVAVFVATNRHKLDQPQYSIGLVIPLVSRADDTRLVVAAALAGLKRIYRTGYGYKKAGVMLSDIVPVGVVQTDLFASGRVESDLMPTLDRINTKWGRSTLRLSVELAGSRWQMRQERKTPPYTTDWHCIPMVR
jgi:DNA polymerase V